MRNLPFSSSRTPFSSVGTALPSGLVSVTQPFPGAASSSIVPLSPGIVQRTFSPHSISWYAISRSPDTPPSLTDISAAPSSRSTLSHASVKQCLSRFLSAAERNSLTGSSSGSRVRVMTSSCGEVMKMSVSLAGTAKKPPVVSNTMRFSPWSVKSCVPFFM